MPSITSSAKIMLLAAVLLARQQAADALRMINLDAPDTALQGDTIHLSCFFALQDSDTNKQLDEEARQISAPRKSKFSSQRNKTSPSGTGVNKHNDDEASGEQVYAIKWYKDEREFFRYLAQDWPRKQSFPMDGVAVDVDKSDNHTVALASVSLKTSGTYRCEVSTDAPSFVTKSITRKMFIYSIPDQGPVIETLKAMPPNNGAKSLEYHLDEPIGFVCSSPESKPAAALDWIINDSMNLSAFIPTVNGSPVFEIKEQRFVRLPSFGNGSTTGIRPLASHISFRQTTRLIPYSTYELLNGTIAVPVHEHLGVTLVGLADSVNQLVEMSSSRLKFTVDSNLLQLISRSKLNGSHVPNKESESNRVARSPENHPSSGPSVSVRSNPIQVQASKDAQVSWTSIRTESNKPPVSSVRQPVGGQTSQIQALRLGNSPAVNKRVLAKAGSSFTMTDKHRLTLRLKCVARILYLSMSDELRLRLSDKPRTRDDELASIGAQRRQTHNEGRSGGTKYLELGRRINIIFFIDALLMLTYHWEIRHIGSMDSN